MPRRYRCPHCRSIEKAEPQPNKAVTISCGNCGGRFRVPRSKGPVRRQTSHSQQQVRDESTREVERMRSQSDRERLARIVRERKLGDYDILDELGRGGMGVVYKAFHRTLKRMVALKIVIASDEDEEVALKRFRREAELHARLNHPNIVNVYESGVIDGISYFAMDFVTGTQLTKLIGSPEFSLKQRLNVIRQVADALHHAHGHGVIHRDIKPDNIIVDPGWKAHLVDFGIAKPTDMSGQENITRAGLAIGTPHYMAPEQFRPKLGDIGPRTDVYSLGGVLYHTLKGHPPFEADSAHAVLIKAATQNPQPLDGGTTPSEESIPADAAAIVKRSMEKDPSQRYQTAVELADDLRRCVMGREVNANPIEGGERLRRKLRRNPGAFLLIASVFTLCFTNVGASVIALLVKSRKLTHVLDIVSLSCAVLLIVVFSWLVVRQMRSRATDIESLKARPDEIGATADEV